MNVPTQGGNHRATGSPYSRDAGRRTRVLASAKNPEERTVMTVFWIIGVSALAVIWVISIVDVFRRHYSGAAKAGWLALIVLLPFIGALIYWGVRKPTPGEVEQQYLEEAELRRSTAARPFDSTGL
jgi:hypothetical protein